MTTPQIRMYQEQALDAQDRITKALDRAFQSGGVDGAHHKAWVIDQMVRALTGEEYVAWVMEHNTGEDGPNTYNWDVGIPP